MAGLLDGVDQRTKLVGANRLELLLFSLGGRQRFGINVFKVQEVIQCPTLTNIPNANPLVSGIANMRGKTITVMDLGRAIGKHSQVDPKDCFVIITEYNRTIQGFLVDSVDRIVNMNWEEILPPPKGVGKDNYMTAVTRVDGELIEIIDVEKVLAELIGVNAEIADKTQLKKNDNKTLNLLVVDDSSVARNQIKRTLDQMGMDCVLAKNGREGLDKLLEMQTKGSVYDQVDVVISDVEMPEMDGYTLTTEIRANSDLKDLPVLLHTSLSGVFNNSMVEKVGADKFVPKFNAEELAKEVKELIASKGLA